MKYKEDLSRAEGSYAQHKAALLRLKKTKPKNLDEVFHHLHEEAFQEIDCLECANCCKTTSPIFLDTDIERLARTLKMKPQKFITTYLRKDEEGDHVLLSAPCPFLGYNNECIVYENRPRACREYPHTNRKRMHQIMPITLKNTLVCPAVARIVKKLSALYPG